MSSFPSRFLRSLLGPKFFNAFPVENPENQVGDKQFNAAFHAVAGMNLIVSRAALIATYSGGSFQIAHQAEAWNPEAAQAHPSLARTSAGVYTYTFAASYLDEDGVAVPTVLAAARVSSHYAPQATYPNRIESRAWVDESNPLIIQVRMWNTSGVPVDLPFWLEVF